MGARYQIYENLKSERNRQWEVILVPVDKRPAVAVRWYGDMQDAADEVDRLNKEGA